MEKISVIMGIFNCEDTLEESLISLVNQTYQNFNVILCDDGSTDNTYKIAKKYVDKYPGKFILLQNENNKGLNYTLNRCLKLSTGEYIARMDADDIALPERFEIQNKYLDKHADYAFVSSNMHLFDETGVWGKTDLKENPKKEDLIKGAAFAHAPAMIRRDAFVNVGGYSVSPFLIRVEDLHLWIKLYANDYYGYNILRPLYKARDDKAAYKRRTFRNRINEAYVKSIALKELQLPLWNIIYILRPILVGLLPEKVYLKLHQKKLKS